MKGKNRKINKSLDRNKTPTKKVGSRTNHDPGGDKPVFKIEEPDDPLDRGGKSQARPDQPVQPDKDISLDSLFSSEMGITPKIEGNPNKEEGSPSPPHPTGSEMSLLTPQNNVFARKALGIPNGAIDTASGPVRYTVKKFTECRPELVSDLQSFSRAMEYIYNTPIIAISASEKLRNQNGKAWSRPFDAVDGIMPTILFEGAFISFPAPEQELSISDGTWLLPNKVLSGSYEFDFNKYSYFLTSANRIARVNQLPTPNCGSVILTNMPDVPRVTGVSLKALLIYKRLDGILLNVLKEPESLDSWIQRLSKVKLRCSIKNVTNYQFYEILKSNTLIESDPLTAMPYCDNLNPFEIIVLMKDFYNSQIRAWENTEARKGKCTLRPLIELCDLILSSRSVDLANELIHETGLLQEKIQKREVEVIEVDFNKVAYTVVTPIEITHQGQQHKIEVAYSDFVMPHYQSMNCIMGYTNASPKILLASIEASKEQNLEWRFGRSVIKLSTLVPSYKTRRSSIAPKRSRERFRVNSWLHGFLPYAPDPTLKSFRRLYNHIINGWLHENLRLDIVQPVAFKTTIKAKVSPESNYIDFDDTSGVVFNQPSLLSEAGLVDQSILDNLQGLDLDFSKIISEDTLYIKVGEEKFAWTSKSLYNKREEGEQLRDYVIRITSGRLPESRSDKVPNLDLLFKKENVPQQKEISSKNPEIQWKSRVTSLALKYEDGKHYRQGNVFNKTSDLFGSVILHGLADFISVLCHHRHGDLHYKLRKKFTKDPSVCFLMGYIPKNVTEHLNPKPPGRKVSFSLFDGHTFSWRYGQ
jgi:hypothetical protein